MNEKTLKEFLEGLAELTKKKGVAIGGCGCCGSPYLYIVDGAGTYRVNQRNDGDWGERLCFEEEEKK